MEYKFCAQGCITVASINDKEELNATDESFDILSKSTSLPLMTAFSASSSCFSEPRLPGSRAQPRHRLRPEEELLSARALKANDEEAYLKLLDQAKDTRITHLLRALFVIFHAAYLYA